MSESKPYGASSGVPSPAAPGGGVKETVGVYPSSSAPSTSGASSASTVSASAPETPSYADRMKEAAREYVPHGHAAGTSGQIGGQSGPQVHPHPHEDHGHHGPADNPVVGAAKSIPYYLNELASWAAYWVTAKLDGLKLTLRNVVIYAALGVVGLIAAVAVVCYAVILLLGGLADGLGQLFGMMTQGHGLAWLGPFLVGLLVLGAIALGIKMALSKVMGASRKQTELKYEGKRIRQRVEFGRDVHERAQQSNKRKRQQSQ